MQHTPQLQICKVFESWKPRQDEFLKYHRKPALADHDFRASASYADDDVFGATYKTQPKLGRFTTVCRGYRI